MTPLATAEFAGGVCLAACIPAYWLAGMAKEARRERAERKERVRARRAHLAAIEAAEDDDPAFAPDAVRRSIVQMVALADRVWRGRTSTALNGRPDGELINGWARARLAWLGAPLRVRGIPAIDLLRVVNRPGDGEDRVVARVRVKVHCGRSPLDVFARRNVDLDERWTLGHRDGSWMLLSADGDPLAGPVLNAPLIPTPAHDTDRLQEESLAELAVAQRVPTTIAPDELVDAEQPPALALLDLSVVDGRFSPQLIAAQLAHLVEAWEEAITGSQSPLQSLGSTDAVTALLRPSPGMRLLMRDSVLKSWQPTHLGLSDQPPTITVRIEIEAIRYLVSDDGLHRAGNDAEPRPIVMTWTMELSGPAKAPWQLAASSNPAEAVPGWSLF